MQKIGEKIDTTKLGCRTFNMEVTRAQLRMNPNKYMCWGARKWVVDKIDESCWLKFYVSGMKFKGNIYIELDGTDLYNVFYCTTHGTIKDIDSQLYGDMLCDVIDNKIEKQANYSF